MQQVTRYLRVFCAIPILFIASLNTYATEKLSPETAYSNNGSVPKNAKEISEKKALMLLESGNAVLEYPSKTKNEIEVLKKSYNENADYLRKMIAYYPSLKRFEHLLNLAKSEKVDGAGTYLSQITYRNGEKSTVALLGANETIRMLASSIRSMNSRQKQAEIYQARWDSLPKDVWQKYKSRIVSPEIVSKESLRIIGKRNLQLSETYLAHIRGLRASGVLPPAERPLNCAAEIGSGDGTDRAVNRGPNNAYGIDQPGRHHEDSLFARAYFPMKWMTGCVKQQGNRGLCTVFAAMGALETSIAIRDNKWVNLSEQYAWASNRLNQFRSPDTPNVELLGELDTPIPYESGWDYNPSYFQCTRANCPADNGFQGVCDNYSAEHCSETNHQGENFFWCDRTLNCYSLWNIDPSIPSEHKIKDVLNLWTENNTQLFNIAVSWTMAPTAAAGMTMGILADFSGFGNRGRNCQNDAGFLIYDSACKQAIAQSVAAGNSPGGGHQVQIVAAIPNDLLPEGVPRASSDGWYVLKNSWSSNWGEQGWVYVPSDWIADHGTGMWVISNFE
ncbi:MAG: hypothetical protein HOJ76_11995 [Proteobacteria bacterium]|nr:hypothetical protein [Pseudomonadota bacterium]